MDHALILLTVEYNPCFHPSFKTKFSESYAYKLAHLDFGGKRLCRTLDSESYLNSP